MKTQAGRLLLFMVVSLSLILTACGGTTPTTNTGPVDITFWASPTAPEGAAPPADWEGYKIIREKLKINLKFSMIPAGPDGETKLNAKASANDLPDLFQVITRPMFYKFAEQGLLAPVDELLAKMPERTKLRYSDANLNNLAKIDGTMFALQEKALLYKREGLFIRQDWLDKLGLKAPTTLDELLNVAKAFTERDPDGNGQNDTYGLGAIASTTGTLGNQLDFIFGAYGLAGSWQLDNPKNFGMTLKNPDYYKGMQFAEQLVKSKVVDPDWTTMKLDDYRARWKQGKYGMFVEDFCAATCVANYSDFDANNPSGNLAIIDPPKGPAGKSALRTYNPTGIFYAVSKKAMDAGKGDAIARLLEWANSGEGYDLLAFGEEGVNYKKDAAGNFTTEGIDPKLAYSAKEQQPILQLRNLAATGSDAELTARYPAFKTKDGRDIAPLEFYKTSSSKPHVDNTATLLIPPASNSADMGRYINENSMQFVLGQKQLTPAAWSEFINGLENLGVSEYEKESKQILQDGGFLK